MDASAAAAGFAAHLPFDSQCERRAQRCADTCRRIVPHLVFSRLGYARCSHALAPRRLYDSHTRRLFKLLRSCDHWRRVNF
eukprot:2378390-Pleurochrysis_carterae.AAC.1